MIFPVLYSHHAHRPSRLPSSANVLCSEWTEWYMHWCCHGGICISSSVVGHGVSVPQSVSGDMSHKKGRISCLQVLPNILGGGVPHGSWNPDPISDQNVWFFIPLFRPDPEKLCPISDLTPKIYTPFRYHGTGFRLHNAPLEAVWMYLVNVKITRKINVKIIPYSRRKRQKPYPISD